MVWICSLRGAAPHVFDAKDPGLLGHQATVDGLDQGRDMVDIGRGVGDDQGVGVGKDVECGPVG